MTKKILLVEDDLFLGDLIVEILERHDYAVTWFCRARNVEGDIVFMNDRGLETDFSAAGYQDVVNSFEFALVDYRLKGSVLQGLDVTRALCKWGVTVIACSGLPSLNREMVEAGAAGGIEKHEIITRVLRDDNLLHNLTSPSTARPRKT